MKRFLILITASLFMLSCGSSRQAQQTNSTEPSADPVVLEGIPDGEEYSPTTLIIMYDEQVGKGPLLKAIAQYGAEIIYDYSIIPGMAISIPEKGDIQDAIKFFRTVEGVVSVERDRIYHLTDPVLPPTVTM